MNKVMALSLYLFFFLGKLLLKFRDLSVYKGSCLLIVSLPLQDLSLAAFFIYLLTDSRKPVGSRLFIFPFCLLGRKIVTEL